MKKGRIIAILGILVGLTACTKVENYGAPERISYAVGNYASATKASSYKDYEGLESFRSRAYLHAEGAAEGTEFFTSNIIWDESAKTWAPSRDYYWPKHQESYINFVSWYANDGSADIEPSTVSETAFEITGRTIGADDRILVADEAWRQHFNSSTYQHNGVSSGVPTLFHHLLSRVKLNMKVTTTTDPEIAGVTYEVSIQDVHFEGIFQRGNLRLQNADPSATGTREWYSSTSATYLWTTVAGSNSENVTVLDSETILGTDYQTVLSERSFLPQSMENDIKLCIKYSVTTKSNGVTTSQENEIPATVVMNTIKNTSDVAITQWVPNKVYTYNITINPIGREILLNPVVESEWSFEEDINVTVE